MLALLRHLCGLFKVRHRGKMGDCCSYDARGINDMNASWVCLDRRSHSWCVVSTGEVLLLTMCFVPGTSKYVDWCVKRPTYVWQQQPDLPLLDLSVFLFERSEFLIDTSPQKIDVCSTTSLLLSLLLMLMLLYS